ncbi:MAG TPA: class I SAM-dependent methyltransferase [Gemmatimonadales bacterium]|nr:class I SAM-dependent methyltransferase [Gemmatimonadales bacterium]
MAADRGSSPRFEDITETTGIPLSPEGASMMYTRYAMAAELAAGKRVLELGCGSGQGFGLMAAGGARIVGGDYSHALLKSGRRYYGNRFPFVRLSGDALPFRDATFDVVLCFEASYYVPDMTRGFAEIARVLAPGGTVLFVNANPERPDFITSPHATYYHTADEFRAALEALGLRVTVEGAFPVDPPATGFVGRAKAQALALARRILEASGLVPQTLRGRARLKRIVYGSLVQVPAELPPHFAPVAPRVLLGSGPVREFKVIYVRGDRPR